MTWKPRGVGRKKVCFCFLLLPCVSCLVCVGFLSLHGDSSMDDPTQSYFWCTLSILWCCHGINSRNWNLQLASGLLNDLARAIWRWTEKKFLSPAWAQFVRLWGAGICFCRWGLRVCWRWLVCGLGWRCFDMRQNRSISVDVSIGRSWTGGWMARSI